jgi:hypothetical protein
MQALLSSAWLLAVATSTSRDARAKVMRMRPPDRFAKAEA